MNHAWCCVDRCNFKVGYEAVSLGDRAAAAGGGKTWGLLASDCNPLTWPQNYFFPYPFPFHHLESDYLESDSSHTFPETNKYERQARISVSSRRAA
jgi:hypothetical protein